MKGETDISLDEIRECDETVEVNAKAIEALVEAGALRNTGYAAERRAKSCLKDAIGEGI